jgi:hypothetical protein
MGVFCMFQLLLTSNVISKHGLPDRGTRLTPIDPAGELSTPALAAFLGISPTENPSDHDLQDLEAWLMTDPLEALAQRNFEKVIE